MLQFVVGRTGNQTQDPWEPTTLWKLDLVNFWGVVERLTKLRKIDYFKGLIT